MSGPQRHRPGASSRGSAGNSGGGGAVPPGGLPAAARRRQGVAAARGPRRGRLGAAGRRGSGLLRPRLLSPFLGGPVVCVLAPLGCGRREALPLCPPFASLPRAAVSSPKAHRLGGREVPRAQPSRSEDRKYVVLELQHESLSRHFSWDMVEASQKVPHLE